MSGEIRYGINGAEIYVIKKMEPSLSRQLHTVKVSEKCVCVYI